MKDGKETRVCSWCQRKLPKEEFCAPCAGQFKARPSASSLTPDEREAEMRALNGPMEIPFEMIHGRIQELVGRPVWTHEIGCNWEGLCREARWETEGATIGQIVDLIPEEKRIVVQI